LFPYLIPLVKRHILSFYKITSTQESFFLPSFIIWPIHRTHTFTHTHEWGLSLPLFFNMAEYRPHKFSSIIFCVCFRSSYYQLVNYMVQFTLSNQTQDNTIKHIQKNYINEIITLEYYHTLTHIEHVLPFQGPNTKGFDIYSINFQR